MILQLYASVETIKSVLILLMHGANMKTTEKQSKYQDVAFEIKQQYLLYITTAFPLVLSAARIIPNILNLSVSTVNLPPCLLYQLQKVVVLKTHSIVRKFLNNKAHLSHEESYNGYSCNFTTFLALNTHFINPDANPRNILGSKPHSGSLTSPDRT